MQRQKASASQKRSLSTKAGLKHKPLSKPKKTTLRQTKRKISTKPIQQQQMTLFGGYGQTGPYVAQYLGPTGMRMIAAYRDDGHHIRNLKLVGELGQVVPKFFDWRQQDSLKDTLRNTDLVINLIGSSNPTMHFNEYDANLRTALQIAKTAKEMGATRFIHVSAAGASPHAGSKFLRAKYESEEAVKTYFPDATIVRPCFIFDSNTVYLHTLARAAEQTKPMIAFAETSIQPTYARDVGAAIAQLALHPEIDGQTWTLGGQEAMTRAELFQRFANMIAHNQSVLGQTTHRPQFLAGTDSFRQFAREQLFFANPLNRVTPQGECDYFSTDVTLDIVPKTKGFAELGIKPSDTNLTLLRVGKAYLSNLSTANSSKLFTWDSGCLDEGQRKLKNAGKATVGTHIPFKSEQRLAEEKMERDYIINTIPPEDVKRAIAQHEAEKKQEQLM